MGWVGRGAPFPWQLGMSDNVPRQSRRALFSFQPGRSQKRDPCLQNLSPHSGVNAVIWLLALQLSQWLELTTATASTQNQASCGFLWGTLAGGHAKLPVASGTPACLVCELPYCRHFPRHWRFSNGQNWPKFPFFKNKFIYFCCVGSSFLCKGFL